MVNMVTHKFLNHYLALNILKNVKKIQMVFIVFGIKMKLKKLNI